MVVESDRLISENCRSSVEAVKLNRLSREDSSHRLLWLTIAALIGGGAVVVLQLLLGFIVLGATGCGAAASPPLTPQVAAPSNPPQIEPHHLATAPPPPAAPPAPPAPPLPPHAPDNLGPCGLEQQWTSAAGATLSIIGTAIVIPVGIYALIMHAMYASSFKTMLSILTCLAISDFLFALRYLLWAGWIISDPASVIWNPASMANSFNCLFSAWLGQFAGCASISWSFCAAVYLALVIAASKAHIELDAKRQRDFLISCHLLVWGFSLATCIVGQAGDLFVMSNTGTCWFGDRYIWIFCAQAQTSSTAMPPEDYTPPQPCLLRTTLPQPCLPRTTPPQPCLLRTTPPQPCLPRGHR